MHSTRSRYCQSTLQVLALFALMQLTSVAGESQKVTGRIIDENGNPVVGVTIAQSWKSIEPDKESVAGRPTITLAPRVEPFTMSDHSGDFSSESEHSSLGILALDSSGERGAIAFRHDLVKTGGNEIRIGRLTQITCRFPKMFQSREIDRIYLTVCLAEVDSQPLADTRLVHITGVREDYSFKLPSGSYRLDVTAITSGNPSLELSLTDNKHFKVEGQRELELGELQLRAFTDPEVTYARKIRALRDRQSSNESESRDSLFGRISPSWISIDGSGLDHRANIEALRGKWVLLEFWGLNCLPCLKEGIPNLIDFYKRNERHRDRFEIVGLFLDFTGRIDSVASLQEKLEPIKENVWGGKAISFPIVIDNTFSNWERYAIRGLGDCLLIDPDGRIVRGDLESLQEILDGGEPRVAR